MPAQIGTRAFDGSIPIVNEVLREANGPVWLLSRTQESLRSLAYRIRNMPSRYEQGLVIKNLFFGSTDKFMLWEKDELHDLVTGGGWLETELPELNDSLTVMIGRKPFHEVLYKGINGEFFGTWFTALPCSHDEGQRCNCNRRPSGGNHSAMYQDR